MEISARRQDGITIFNISGNIDFANSRKLRQSMLQEIQNQRTQRVVVNLNEVHYIDSSGVASLVEALRASHDLGSRFLLCGLSSPAREVLKVCRLIKVFEVFDSEEIALAS